ncbi:hypothetical protein [Bacillus sp. REN3]|nr:hypothetical protein [Bacillus sp. REN3]
MKKIKTCPNDYKKDLIDELALTENKNISNDSTLLESFIWGITQL